MWACMSLFFAVLLIGIERLCAAMWRQRYIQNTGGFLGKLLVGLLWLAGGLLLLGMIYLSQWEPDLYFCTNLFVQNRYTVLVINSLTIITDAIVLTMFGYLWHYSRTTLSFFAVNQAHSTLRGRFETQRNIRLTKMLFPSVLLHFAAYVIVMSLAFPAHSHRTQKSYGNLALTNMIFCLIVLHAAAHPWVCFAFSSRLRGVLLKKTVSESLDEGLQEAEGHTKGRSRSVVLSHHKTPEEFEQVLLHSWKTSSRSNVRPHYKQIDRLKKNQDQSAVWIAE